MPPRSIDNLSTTGSVYSHDSTTPLNPQNVPTGFEVPPHPGTSHRNFMKISGNSADQTNEAIFNQPSTSTAAQPVASHASTAPQKDLAFVCMSIDDQPIGINGCYIISDDNRLTKIDLYDKVHPEDPQETMLSVIAQHKKESYDSRKHKAIHQFTSKIPDVKEISREIKDNFPKIAIDPALIFSSEEALKKYITDHFNSHPRKDALKPEIKNKFEKHISSWKRDKVLKLLEKHDMGIDTALLMDLKSVTENLMKNVPADSKPMSITFNTEASRPSKGHQPVERFLQKIKLKTASSSKSYPGDHTFYGLIDKNHNVYLLTGDKNKKAKNFIKAMVDNFVAIKTMSGLSYGDILQKKDSSDTETTRL